MSAQVETVVRYPLVRPGSWAVWLLAREGIDLSQQITCVPATIRRAARR